MSDVVIVSLLLLLFNGITDWVILLLSSYIPWDCLQSSPISLSMSCVNLANIIGYLFHLGLIIESKSFFFLISKENSFKKRRLKSDSRYTAYVRYTNLYTRHQKRPKTYKDPPTKRPNILQWSHPIYKIHQSLRAFYYKQLCLRPKRA